MSIDIDATIPTPNTISASIVSLGYAGGSTYDCADITNCVPGASVNVIAGTIADPDTIVVLNTGGSIED